LDAHTLLDAGRSACAEVKMPKNTVYEAKVDFMQILDEDANFDESLGVEDGEPILADEQVVYLYEQMWIGRQLDEIAFKLQRSGRMGTYPQNKG